MQSFQSTDFESGLREGFELGLQFCKLEKECSEFISKQDKNLDQAKNLRTKYYQIIAKLVTSAHISYQRAQELRESLRPIESYIQKESQIEMKYR